MKSRSIGVWLLMLAAGCGLAALGVYARHTPGGGGPPPDDAATRSTPSAPPAQAAPKSEPGQILVFVPSMGASGIGFTKASEALPAGADPRLFAVNAFLKASKLTPDGAEALGVDLRDGGVAVISFNSDFPESFGSFEEKSVVDGLAAALGQFPEVSAYQMQVAGRLLTSLGSADLSAPVPVVRPDAVPLGPPAGTDEASGPNSDPDSPLSVPSGSPAPPAANPEPGDRGEVKL